MNRGLRKDLLREIRHSATRFLSILVMVALGVMFLVGLRSAAPDMRTTADTFFDQYGLFDLQLLSTLGLTEEDAAAVSALDGVEVCETGITLDGILTKNKIQKVVKLHSIGAELNRPVLLDGNLPEAAGDCAIDDRLASSLGLSLGDTILLEPGESGQLACEEFTVTGIVQSSLYISLDRGTSTLGDGSVAGFLLLGSESFTLDYVTQIYLRLSGSKELDAYGPEYQALLDEVSARVEPVLQDRAALRYEDLKVTGRQRLIDGRAELNEERQKAFQELQDGRAQLMQGRYTLDRGWEALESGRREYEDGIAEGEAALQAARETLDQGKADLASAESQLSAGRIAYAGAEAMYNSNLESAQQSVVLADQAAAAAQTAWINADAEARALEQEAEAYRAALDEQIRNGISSGTNPAEGTYTFEGLSRALLNASLARVQADACLDQLNRANAETVRSRSALEQTRQEGGAQLAAAQATISQAEAAIAAGKQSLAQGEADYAAGIEELERQKEEGAQALIDAEAELNEKEDEYRQGRADLEAGRIEAETAFAEAEETLDKAARSLADLNPAEIYVLDRNTNYGFVSYDQNAERMANLAKMFPIIFFLVAALVCLTTMTRMVDEERMQIGAIKALGFGTGAIAGKFLAYGITAALLGAILGAAVGTVVIPWIIFSSYGIMYILPKLHLQIYWPLCLGASAAGLGCTVISTIWAVFATARQTPAELMRPKAPKAGKRILLERVTPIWKRLSFSMKVSARNLFRYKKRFWMTVIGVAGCTGLLIAGLGLHSSIFDILDVQFFDLYQYDIQVTLDADAENILERTGQLLDKSGAVASRTATSSRSVTFSANGATVDGYVTVTEDPQGYAEQVRLRTEDGKQPLEISDQGALIDEKLAELLDLSVGDSVTVDLGQRYEMTVIGIREHYVYHYALVTGDYYESVTGERPAANELLVSLTEPTEDNVSALCRRLMKLDGVRSAGNKSSMAHSFRKTMEVVDTAVSVIVLSAAALAFVVLYNLTNINITERIRELATIKVLGFYDMEVGMYVYRENFVLTVFGILLGQIFGKYLCTFLIRTIEMDIVMFGRDAKTENYLFSVLLSVVFALIVNFFMYFRMKKIDMVQSLKSVE